VSLTDAFYAALLDFDKIDFKKKYQEAKEKDKELSEQYNNFLKEVKGNWYKTWPGAAELTANRNVIQLLQPMYEPIKTGVGAGLGYYPTRSCGCGEVSLPVYSPHYTKINETEFRALIAGKLRDHSHANYNIYQAPYDGFYKWPIDLLIEFGGVVLGRYPNHNHGNRLCYIIGFPGKYQYNTAMLEKCGGLTGERFALLLHDIPNKKKAA
jgi:hypothetical protein